MGMKLSSHGSSRDKNTGQGDTGYSTGEAVITHLELGSSGGISPSVLKYHQEGFGDRTSNESIHEYHHQGVAAVPPAHMYDDYRAPKHKPSQSSSHIELMRLSECQDRPAHDLHEKESNDTLW
jgi:hypothetical protein